MAGSTRALSLSPMLEEARERARQRALETIWAARGDGGLKSADL
jgi:hypothetical protein